MNIQAKKVIDQEQKKVSLTESFLQYFTVGLAITPAQKENVYKIRYRAWIKWNMTRMTITHIIA